MQNTNDLNVKEVFSKRLRALREENQLSQDALAEKLGISRGSISFYENGTRTPDIEVFCRIASFFNVSLNYLMGLANAGRPENEEISEQVGLSDKAIDILKSKKNSGLPLFVNSLIEHPSVEKLAFKFSRLKNDIEEIDEIFKNPVFDPTDDEEEIAESIAQNNKKMKEQTSYVSKHLGRRVDLLYGEKILNYERYELERMFRRMLLEMAGTTEEKIQKAKQKVYGNDIINEVAFRTKSFEGSGDEWLDFLEEND